MTGHQLDAALEGAARRHWVAYDELTGPMRDEALAAMRRAMDALTESGYRILPPASDGQPQQVARLPEGWKHRIWELIDLSHDEGKIIYDVLAYISSWIIPAGERGRDGEGNE